ncbi:hypothetical protein Ahy_A05g025375 [Arachis hypogaea]|uniref:MULE transposase domain-containing protein n=1 Tax=Arachis hypogaea TaxID=3818 RepID=A0A445D8J1_ARAHY|nr:hypothetical protein Ahy_A05g025375 [Arachis hypogaea]
MHLYDKYGGVLLIAVAQDNNINILPVAFAIVESRTMESCPSKAEYEQYMDALRGLLCEMTDCAGKFNKKIWSQHCDNDRRFWHITTNLSECIKFRWAELDFLIGCGFGYYKCR